MTRRPFESDERAMPPHPTSAAVGAFGARSPLDALVFASRTALRALAIAPPVIVVLALLLKASGV